MPIQIIPEKRPLSTVEKFARAFSGGANLLGEYLGTQKQKELQEQQLAQELEAGKRMGLDLQGLSSQSRQKAFEQHFSEEAAKNKAEREFANQINLERERSRLRREEEGEKLKGTTSTSQEDQKAVAQNAFNEMANIFKKGNLGLTSGPRSYLSGKTGRDVGKFQSLTGALESLLVHMVNKGTLSDARFKYITETLLPKSNDQENVIKGKLEGLAEILGLDASQLTGKNKPQKAGIGIEKERPPLSSFNR